MKNYFSEKFVYLRVSLVDSENEDLSRTYSKAFQFFQRVVKAQGKVCVSDVCLECVCYVCVGVHSVLVMSVLVRLTSHIQHTPPPNPILSNDNSSMSIVHLVSADLLLL